MSFGRFAPSPSGDLHLGNLRTALLAWLVARSNGRGFLVRMEDLDRDRTVPGMAERQLADLAALGLTWDGEVLFQSERLEVYAVAIDQLTSAGRTYECFCTRREIREASSAPQGALDGRYRGTCRELTSVDRSRLIDAGRRPALRLRTEIDRIAVVDSLHPDYVGSVDDIVLRRNDGVPAYNLAVVVDDAAQDVDQVVRGDDLLASTASQVHLADMLGLSPPAYAHVPLTLNRTGQRLAKRDGAVTLEDLSLIGVAPTEVLGRLGESLGLSEPGEDASVADLLTRFDLDTIPRDPWVIG